MSDSTKSLSKVIRIDEGEIWGHLNEMVRATVEEPVNAMLDAEADKICNAQRYEHSPEPGLAAISASSRPKRASLRSL